MFDQNGSMTANYVYAGGYSPYMKIDANGNPIYYLTDGMGSVIGLADQSGQSAAKFSYDSFGNIRNQSGNLANTTGGDFRFQGQWLESETGIYHYRARDYDSKTGTFLSRDPVDPNEQTPEAMNPYQAMYNNAYVYSDPTGMFTLSEINIANKIGDILEGIYRKNAAQFGRRAMNEAQGVATEVFSSVLRSITPQWVDNLPVSPKSQGELFEEFAQGIVCGVISSTFGQYIDNVWLEVGVDKNGNPQNNGRFNCSNNGQVIPAPNQTSRSNKYNHPDFVIRSGAPVQGDRRPPAYLIGDFKRSVTTIKPSKNQWSAIMNYARTVADFNPSTGFGHQYVPVALYVTLYGSDRANRSAEARLKRRAALNHVKLQILSFL